MRIDQQLTDMPEEDLIRTGLGVVDRLTDSDILHAPALAEGDLTDFTWSSPRAGRFSSGVN